MNTYEILQSVKHRPWPKPTQFWRYYQEWNNAIFLHWRIEENVLQKLVPPDITVDTFEGYSWVSLVAFTMENIKPRFLPSISAISDFHEINIRTYVIRENKPGVYFLNIEAEKKLSCTIAKALSGLPYEKAIIKRFNSNEHKAYTSLNTNKQFSFETHFNIGTEIQNVTLLDKWLTERYCLYSNNNSDIFRYEIHHKPWQLFSINIAKLITHYKIGDIDLSRKPDLVHFSNGVKVIAWAKQRLK